jgi:hypothetical protein
VYDLAAKTAWICRKVEEAQISSLVERFYADRTLLQLKAWLVYQCSHEKPPVKFSQAKEILEDLKQIEGHPELVEEYITALKWLHKGAKTIRNGQKEITDFKSYLQAWMEERERE